jgi:hypothetical protein
VPLSACQANSQMRWTRASLCSLNNRHTAGRSRASYPVSRGKPSASGPDGLPEVHGDSTGCGWPVC